MTRTAEVALACGDTLGESATWSVREQRLYWVDIRAPALHGLDPVTGRHDRWPLPELCGGVVPAASGVLLVLRHAIVGFDRDTGRTTPLCEIEPEERGNRLNEAKCDRDGRLWVGSMRDFAAATTGSLYRVDPPMRVRQVLRDITIPNSLGWSPDGATLYFADTADGAIRAYDYDRDSGAIGAMRLLAEPGALPGRPDGCTLDAEGCLWTTRVGAGLVLRMAPDGRVIDRIALPTVQPTSCSLGGRDLQTLFVTTARQRLDAAQLQAQPTAGHLFACRVDVPGLPEPVCTLTAAQETCG